MTTVHLTEDLERFIRNAVSTGRYASEDSVISDALTRLREAIEPPNGSATPGAEPGQPGKQLTKQEFQRHLVNIGLLDQPPQASASTDNPDLSLIDNEGEIVSERVIRERLIEWLTGFL
jgi:hypothetical protein